MQTARRVNHDLARGDDVPDHRAANLHGARFDRSLDGAGLGDEHAALALELAAELAVDAELRGRVMGLYMLVFVGGAAIGAPTIGAVTSHFGARVGMATCGIIPLAAAIIVFSTALFLYGFVVLAIQPLAPLNPRGLGMLEPTTICGPAVTSRKTASASSSQSPMVPSSKRPSERPCPE